MKRFLIALLVFVPSLASAQVSPYPLGVSAPIFGLPASGVSGGGTVTSPQLLLPSGTVLLPGLAWQADPDTGWYWTSDGTTLMSINGVLTHQWGNTYYANSSNSACLQFGAAGDTTLCRSAAGVWQMARTALGTTSSTGLQLVNTTAATGGATVQMSPRLLFRGNAWDTAASQTVDFFWENLPATAATPTGTAKLGYSLNGAAATYPLQILTNASAVGGTVRLLTDMYLNWTGGNNLRSYTNGLLFITDSSDTIGIQFNTGTAAPTSGCTVTANSRNTTGQITATGATTCTITFGAPAWTNAPFCTITPNAAPTTVPYINGDPTTTAFVVAGMTAGDNLKFSYHCVGRL